MATIGQRIRAARTAARLSQAQLAQRVGVAQAAISRIEREDTTEPGVLIAAGIARALGITLDQLVEGNVRRRAPRTSLDERVAAFDERFAVLEERVAAFDERVATLERVVVALREERGAT